MLSGEGISPSHNKTMTKIKPSILQMTAEQKKQAKEFKDEKNALAYVVQYNLKNTKKNFAIARNFGGRFFVELVNEAAIPANSERVYVK